MKTKAKGVRKMRGAINRLAEQFVRSATGLVLFSLAAILTAIPASASMIVSGATTFSFTGEGSSYTHYATPGDPMSGVTGTSQVYLGTFATPALLLPDPENYGLQISKGLPLGFGVTAWDAGVAIGEYDWALSYYSPEPASVGSPYHSVLYGTTTNEVVTFDPANDGPGGPIQDIAYGSLTLEYDGSYHAVSGGLFGTGTTTLELTVTLYEVGINGAGQNEWSTVPIPEPGTLVLMFSGLVGLAARPRGIRLH